MWDSLHVEAMVEGNLGSAQSKQLAESVLSVMKAKPLEAEGRAIDQVVHVPEGSSYLLRYHPHPLYINSPGGSVTAGKPFFGWQSLGKKTD